MDREQFYRECAEILGTNHEFNPKQPMVTGRDGHPKVNTGRWDRSLGSGRFPGRGVIRLFGERVHVCLRDPVAVMSFDNPTAALKWLRENASPDPTAS